jgi:hypothetical protein
MGWKPLSSCQKPNQPLQQVGHYYFMDYAPPARPAAELCRSLLDVSTCPPGFRALSTQEDGSWSSTRQVTREPDSAEEGR